jgi:hypothetical protein
LQPVRLHLRVLDAQDTTLRDQASILAPAEFATSRTANARFPVPLQNLPPGEYLLRLEATLGDRRTNRLVRFSVR